MNWNMVEILTFPIQLLGCIEIGKKQPSWSQRARLLMHPFGHEQCFHC